MKKPALTVDAILAALAAISVAPGCSKRENVAAEPAPMTTATATATAASTAAAAPAPPPAADDGAEAPRAAQARGAALVDAGQEQNKKGSRKAGGSAMCGASGCSEDMRKGGK